MAERYVVADHVGWLATRRQGVPQVTLAALPDGPPFALHDASAAIWLATVDLGYADDVVRRVAAETEETEETVRADVVTFLAELAERGFLVAQSSSSPNR